MLNGSVDRMQSWGQWGARKKLPCMYVCGVTWGTLHESGVLIPEQNRPPEQAGLQGRGGEGCGATHPVGNGDDAMCGFRFHLQGQEGGSQLLSLQPPPPTAGCSLGELSSV